VPLLAFLAARPEATRLRIEDCNMAGRRAPSPPPARTSGMR
jgi:hypothetical protein